MKLTTIHWNATTTAARKDPDGYVPIVGFSDVGDLLSEWDWRDIAETTEWEPLALDDSSLCTLFPAPGKIICAGLNYRSHIVEMGRAVPDYPTLFAKFADTLTGPFDPITVPDEDDQVDWEGELALVIGSTAYRVSEVEAPRHIAGYTVANDISMRGWQNRTNEWLQGKMWRGTCPVGPVVVTPDEFDAESAVLCTRVNGEVVQEHAVADLVFPPAQLVSYISTILPLRPGDLVLTGTPGGIGHARQPRMYLKAGDVVEVEIDGIGRLSNVMVR